MDLSDEEYVPEHPTEASTGKGSSSAKRKSTSSPVSTSVLPVAGNNKAICSTKLAKSDTGPIADAANNTTDDSLSALHDEPIEDSTEPYEPFEGEDIDDAFMPLMNPTLSSQDESVASIPTPPVIPQNQPEQQQQPQQIPLPPQQHRPPLLPDPEYPPPFAFQAQQQQPQRKQWDMPPPQFNNFGSGLPNLADLANFGEFPNLAAGLNNLNPPQPAGLPPHMWNNQQQPPPMGPMGGGGGPMGGNQFSSPNRPPFGGSPFNNNNNKMNNFRNHNNNSWGGGGRGGGGGGGPRHGSPYFRGGGGGGRGNFRGANNKFRGGHHNNNRGGNW